MNFKIYNVEENYLNRLVEKDSRVSLEHDDGKPRPYTGILVMFNGFKYIIPLSSPKAKHKKMKDSEDFLKINKGIYGALNFNNMIPVCSSGYYQAKIDKEEKEYKNLVLNQLRWMNNSTNKKRIINLAYTLRENYERNVLRKSVLERCCNFIMLEKIAKNVLLII